MTAIWWLVPFAGLGGLCFAIRARAIRGRKPPEASSGVSAELIHRADQQNRWAVRGDTRGVYGVKGAELMRRISPEPSVDATSASAEYPPGRRGRLYVGEPRHAAGREAALLAVRRVRLGVGATACRAAIASA